jgi:hypothetical protein
MRRRHERTDLVWRWNEHFVVRAGSAVIRTATPGEWHNVKSRNWESRHRKEATPFRPLSDMIQGLILTGSAAANAVAFPARMIGRREDHIAAGRREPHLELLGQYQQAWR